MWLLALGLGVLAWSTVVSIHVVEKPFLGWLVRTACGSWRRGLVVTWCVHGVLLLLAGVVAVAAISLIRTTGSERSAAWVTLPAVLLYGPVLMCLMFSPSGVSAVERDLRDQGASVAVSRAIAWGSLPFVILGLMLVTAGVFLPFAP